MKTTVLVVAAHPDDEALGCAGTMAKHADQGDEVHVIFMADGVTSRKEESHEELKMRNLSAERACAELKVHSVNYLCFPDNQMDSVPFLDIVRKLEELIAKISPHIIYTHHIGDLNIDHRITNQAVLTACRPIPGQSVKQISTFEVLSSTEWQDPSYQPFTPNRFVDISKYLKVKISALNAYNQELRPTPHSRSIENVVQLASFRGNSIGCAAAEAFMVVRIID